MPQFRGNRMTALGTYLAPFLKMNKVFEYDTDFNPIRTYEIPTHWAAVRRATEIRGRFVNLATQRSTNRAGYVTH
jgi:hypothetical protein